MSRPADVVVLLEGEMVKVHYAKVDGKPVISPETEKGRKPFAVRGGSDQISIGEVDEVWEQLF